MAAANTELRGLVENLGVIRAHLERTCTERPPNLQAWRIKSKKCWEGPGAL